MCVQFGRSNVGVVHFSLDGEDLCYEAVKRAMAGFVYSEAVVSHYLRQLLNAVSYCHDRDIIHRDIQPKCVFLATKDNSAPVKLGGFHLAVQLQGGNAKIHGGRVGCSKFMAPEIVNQEAYGSAADMWNIGIFAFVLLSGSLPFIGKPEEIYKATTAGKFTMRQKTWQYISEYAKDFVVKMLTVDSLRRISVEEALQHPWIQVSVNLR
ncbi:unnamed protein product [Soboliphyme baturini]|uniref:Protein kinase domain-containing protein n=1 Tax=Soboliphyme baturini TaxID=241478 RepID=A0A183IXV8_9BILA|nr:unnamed protein product [Soboliphyme baturini]